MTINTNDVLSAITQASEALAREPKHLEQINFLQRDLGQVQSHNQNLELRIVDYKSNIESLEAKVRSLEVERDQAQFRTLELEDTIHNAVGIFKSASGNLSAALAVIDPPKPEPVAEPSPVISSIGNPELAVPDHSSPVAEQVPVSPPSTPYPDTPPQATADPVGFSGLNEADVKPEPDAKPYAGKRWGDVYPRVNTYGAWVDGGGTDEGWNS